MNITDQAERQKYIEKYSPRYQKDLLKPNEKTLAERQKLAEEAKVKGQEPFQKVMERYIEDTSPTNPTITDDVVGAFTSMGMFFVGGYIAGGGALAPTILESMMEAGSVYDTNRKNGMKPVEAFKEQSKDFVANVVWNHYLNKFSGLFDKVGTSSKSTIKNKIFSAVKAMPFEGTQEAGQQWMSNVFTKAEDQFDSVLKAFGLGALVAGGTSIALDSGSTQDTTTKEPSKREYIKPENMPESITGSSITLRPDGTASFNLEVSETSRGQGVGREAVSKIEQTILDRGVSEVVLPVKEESQGFFEKMGYAVPEGEVVRNGLIKMTKTLTKENIVKTSTETQSFETQGKDVDSLMRAEGWEGGDKMKSRFDTALLLKDATVVNEMLPQVPEYYKTKFAKEISAITGQQVSDLQTQDAPQETKTTKEVSDTPSTVKVENKQVFRGVAGKVSSEFKSFDKVLEVEGYQTQLLQKMAKEGIAEAQTILDNKTVAGKIDFKAADALIRKTYQGTYDAVKYTNTKTGVAGRSQVGTEYHELSTNDFYAENEDTAQLYAKQKGRDKKYSPENAKSELIEKEPTKVEDIKKPTKAKNKSEELVAFTNRYLGDVITIQEPVGDLWVSKGNVVYVKEVRHREGFIAWLKQKNFIKNAQEAGGNNVIKITYEPAMIDNLIFKSDESQSGDYSEVIPVAKKEENKQEKKQKKVEEEVKFTGYNTTESAREVTKNISSIEFPELLRMARLISGNKVLIKALRSRMGGTVLGRHQSGKITLNPEIFEDPELVAKVFAHEFGHMVDFFPDKSMDRGNILGRVASLRGHVARFLEEFKGAEGKPLTSKERSELRKQARQIAKNPVEITTEEIVGNESIDPKDILAIWQDTTAGIKNPELLSYISRLTDAQKKQIVVAAMKGDVPAWVDFKKSVKKTITREVIQNSPADIRKIYQKLIKNEVYKRRLFESEVMTEELKNNTRLWTPFDPKANPAYTEYRYSSKELYAEALSVLFNDPQLLKDNAPTFYTGFFNYLDSKPEVYKTMNEIYNLVSSGSDAVLDARQAEINESFKLAEDKWRLARENKKKSNIDLLFELKNFWVERHARLFEKVKEAQKTGAVIPANENPRYFLEEMTRDGAVLKSYFADRIQPIHDALNASEISWDDLGSVLLYERVINERGELANPFGQNPKTARAGLERMKAQLGSTKWQVLQTQLGAFRKATDHVLKEAEKEGFYKKELIEKMKANPAYANFQVVDYIDSDFATSAVHEQVGTLSGIANAGTSTVMKNLAILNAIEKNKAKRSVVKFMQGFHKADITEAPYVYNATKKIREPRAPRDPKFGIIELMDNGNRKGFYVDKYIS